MLGVLRALMTWTYMEPHGFSQPWLCREFQVIAELRYRLENRRKSLNSVQMCSLRLQQKFGTTLPADQRVGTSHLFLLLISSAKLIPFSQMPFLSKSRIENNLQLVVMLN